MKDSETQSVKVVNVSFGERVKIIEPCNLYGCALGDDVFVGPFVEIQSNVIIGARSKIQSHSFVCELVSIGNDCFIGHGVMFINDKFDLQGPAKGDREKWRPTSIGNNVSVGSNATVMPATICDDVVIGAGAGVTKDIYEPGIYAGNPCRKLRN